MSFLVKSDINLLARLTNGRLFTRIFVKNFKSLEIIYALKQNTNEEKWKQITKQSDELTMQKSAAAH